MKNKIKSLVSAVSLAILTAPAGVLAQSWVPDAEVPDASILDILQNAMDWILIIVGFLGVIGFAIAGILYLTAAGDEDRIKQAKSAMVYSIIGVVVALLGLVIMRAVLGLLNADSSF